MNQFKYILKNVLFYVFSPLGTYPSAIGMDGRACIQGPDRDGHSSGRRRSRLQEISRKF